MTTNPRLTDARLAELRALLEKATPAPWYHHEGDVMVGPLQHGYGPKIASANYDGTRHGKEIDGFRSETVARAALIVAMRNEFSALLDDLRDAREAVAKSDRGHDYLEGKLSSIELALGEKMKGRHSRASGSCVDDLLAEHGKLEQERDSLRAELAAMRAVPTSDDLNGKAADWNAAVEYMNEAEVPRGAFVTRIGAMVQRLFALTTECEGLRAQRTGADAGLVAAAERLFASEFTESRPNYERSFADTDALSALRAALDAAKGKV